MPYVHIRKLIVSSSEKHSYRYILYNRHSIELQKKLKAAYVSLEKEMEKAQLKALTDPD